MLRTSVIWGLAGGYLFYLGAELVWDFFHDGTDYPVAGALFGVAFLAIGGALLFGAWRKYKKDFGE